MAKVREAYEWKEAVRGRKVMGADEVDVSRGRGRRAW